MGRCCQCDELQPQGKDFLSRLPCPYLRPLEKKGLIDAWVDTRISAGEKWKEEIRKALAQARAGVLHQHQRGRGEDDSVFIECVMQLARPGECARVCKSRAVRMGLRPTSRLGPIELR
jgi:hypothetical protein